MKVALPRKVLVANRGEIAVRVFQTCRELGIATVAIYSDADRHAVHRYAADEAVGIGGQTPTESYLQVERVLDAARRTGTDAVHPGYGFLSENAAFARAVEENGLIYIGPTPEQIAAMGDKVQARRLMAAAGVPLIPGTAEPIADERALPEAARAIGYPLLVKAAGGGGGKGIRRVEHEGELLAAWQRATSEAHGAFGDARVYLERLVFPARHIEAQVLGDGEGGALFLGERECSLQRKHQKLLEETPSPCIDETLREELRAAALQGVRALRYRGAGTLEFLYDEARRAFYFMEMNTRLQVEHPVTELTRGVDLVAEQLRIAGGARLTGRAEPPVSGHAIEFRVCAEDPYRGFVPSTGRIQALRLPHAPFTRIDAALREGMEVTPFYDPMLAKVIAWGPDRPTAIARLRALLQRLRIGGIHTTVPLGIEVCRWPSFLEGRYHTRTMEETLAARSARPAQPPRAVRLAGIVARTLLAGAAGSPTHAPAMPGADTVDCNPAPASGWRQAARREAHRGGLS